MNIVKIKDKTFKTSIPEEEILKKVKAVADKINADMADKNPLLLAVLNGSEAEMSITPQTSCV